MKHRLFVAALVSETFAASVFSWCKSHIDLPVRWMAPETYHLTLLPPFYEEDIQKAKDALTGVSGSAFSAHFEMVALKHQLIWAVGETPEMMKNLRTQLEAIFGQPEDVRPVKLHLTLARFRALKAHLHEPISWTETIHTVALLESHMENEGARHEILAKIELSG